MPLASGTAPQTYRWALGLGILIPVVAGALGFLAFAFVAAALVVPAVYVVYLYDVNQWEDQPVGVDARRDRGGGGAGRGLHLPVARRAARQRPATVDFDGNGSGSVRWTSFLVLVLLVPIVGEVLKEVGPILLARRPAFDDMIDGLTFGVAAGAAFAAAETIVVNRGPVLDLRPGGLPEHRLLGLARSCPPPWSSRSCTAPRPASRSPASPASVPGTTGSSPATSAAWPRRWSPTSCSRAGCSSPPASRAPRGGLGLVWGG